MLNRAIITASLGGFQYGYNTGIISGAILFLSTEFSLGHTSEGVVVSMILIGALLGSSIAGVSVDKWGRRKTLGLTAVLFLWGALWVSLSHSITSLLLGRGIQGIALGIVSLASPLYLAEIAPAKQRGRYVSANQLAITIGILAAYICNYVWAASGDWRSMFAFGAVPAILQIFGLFFIQESPSWEKKKSPSWKLLLYTERLKNRELGKEAPQIFCSERATIAERLRTLKNSPGDCFSGKQVNEVNWPEGGASESEKFEAKPTLRKTDFSVTMCINPRFRRLIFIGVSLSVFQQITGINAVIYFAPTIFQEAGFTSSSGAILATVGMGIINVIATTCALFLLDFFGRKPLLFWGLAGMVASLVILSLAFFVQPGTMGIIAIVSLSAYVAFFALGMGPVPWLVIPEIYPLEIRGRAMSLAILANWFSNLIVAFTFLDLTAAITSGGAFLLFAFIGIIALLFTWKFVPETKGKVLQ